MQVQRREQDSLVQDGILPKFAVHLPILEMELIWLFNLEPNLTAIGVVLMLFVGMQLLLKVETEIVEMSFQETPTL